MFDPTARLWPASFQGVPFRVESDSIEDGRRLVVHEFPNRDDPFVEDLGRKAGSFSITAYVVGEGWTGEAAALKALALSRGAGALVLPMDGPQIVRLQEIKRSFAKDKLGFVAFNLSFVREGATSALASVLSLAQLLFDAAGGAVQAFSGLASIIGPATNIVTGLLVAVEAVRADARIEAEPPRALLSEIAQAFDGVSSGVTAESLAAVMETVRAVADAMPPEDVETAFALTAADFAAPELLASPAAVAAERFARAALLIARAEAAPRRVFADRPSAVALRSSLSTAFEAELEAASADRDDAGYAALSAARAALVEWFSMTIIDLRPVVFARLPRHLPAHVVAWRLYGSLDRLDDLAGRNRVRHPGYMPETVEAVAP